MKTAAASNHRLLRIACPCGLLLATVQLQVRADTHIFAGASGTNLNDALVFTVASFYDTQSGYKLPMALRTTGLNKGYYRGDVLTFTALSATDEGTGQVHGRALLGSRLAVELVSVSGPSGGSVAFWEGDGENPGDSVTFSVSVGTTNGTSSFVISENDGKPGTDPYGHIHGRAFTTSLPGLYTVGFRLIDISTNGLNGAPMHTPSAVLPMYFQAGPNIETIQSSSNGFRISFRSAPGVSNVLESTESLTPAAWKSVGPTVRGNSTLQSIIDTNSPTQTRVYRLRLLSTPP